MAENETPNSKELSKKQILYIEKHIFYLGVKTKAATAAEIPYRTVMDWFNQPHFVAAVEAAKNQWEDKLEAAAIGRALKKSDRLLIELLAAINPEKYDKQVRAAKVMKEKKLSIRPTSIVLNMKRGEPPERLKQTGIKSGITADNEDR